MKRAMPVAIFVVGIGLGLGGKWAFDVFKNIPVPAPAPPPITITLTYDGSDDPSQGLVGRLVTAQATTTGTLVKWTILSGPTENYSLLVEDAKTMYFCTPALGDFRLEAVTAVGGEPFRTEAHILIGVGPPPPVPPGPPTPPPPPPTPAPIVADGLCVLLIRDDSVIHDLPQGQIDIINSTAIPAYVKSVATQPKGGYRQYEVHQTDADFTDDPAFWREAFAKAKAAAGFKAPWLLISNGTSGFSGPLPGAEADVVALLKKYTPAKRVSIFQAPKRAGTYEAPPSAEWKGARRISREEGGLPARLLPEFDREELVAWQTER